MRLLAVVGVISAVVASAELDLEREWTGTPPSSYLPELATIVPNKTYIVNLECPGCPFAHIGEDAWPIWQERPRDNALRLEFSIKTLHDDSSTSLLLNGRIVLPLEGWPPYICAWQVPATSDPTTDMTMFSYDPSAFMSHVSMPLQYEHTVLRTEEAGQLWLQFDVTGLPLKKINDPRFPEVMGEPVKLDGEDRKVVQLLLKQQNETSEMFIEDIQVVARKDRVQPYRMKCGRLAMVQTAFDPLEWDEYGRFGTSERIGNLVIGKVGDFWSDHVPNIMVMLSLVMLFVTGLDRLRRQSERRLQDKYAVSKDAEVALLGVEYDDAPPSNADVSIPEIKIEEYD